MAGVYFPKSAKDSNFTVGPLECFGRKQILTRETEERKFFDVACQPLVTKPPPVFPWQQKKVTVFPWQQRKMTTTLKPKLLSRRATTLRSRSSTVTPFHLPRSNASTIGLSTVAGTKIWSDANVSEAIKITENGYKNVTIFPTATTIPTTTTATTSNNSNSSLPTQEYNVNGWWLILIITASSFLVIIVFIFLLLMLRHKLKNGVWCKGLFMFMRTHQQLPKIEIYRHSIGTDSPDILHMEDFKNTKVVDVHLRRGHFVKKKSSANKKTVTFKDPC